jgi:hypothetical protein
MDAHSGMTDTGFPRTTMPDTAQRAARGAENQAQGLSNTGGSTSQSVANELKGATSGNESTNRSHAKGGGEASIVPQKVQEKLPKSVEGAVPNAIHDTGSESGMHRKQDTSGAIGNTTSGTDSTSRSHAKGGGAASIVPQKIQEMLPKAVEDFVPNAIHDTGSQGGLHREQK